MVFWGCCCVGFSQNHVLFLDFFGWLGDSCSWFMLFSSVFCVVCTLLWFFE